MLRRMVAFPKEMMFELENEEVDILRMGRGRKSNLSRKTSTCKVWQCQVARVCEGGEVLVRDAAGRVGSGQIVVCNGK